MMAHACRAAALLACSLPVLAFSTMARAESTSNLSKQELTYEIANTYRILADEQFLNDERKAAAENYRKAQEQAKLLKPETGLVGQEDTELLKTEIDYRMGLLKNDASFWGYEHDVRPMNPVQSWLQFEGTRKQFLDEVAAIDRLVERDDKASSTSVDAELGVLDELEKTAVSALDQQSAETELKYAALRRSMVEDRMSAISQRQLSIASERDNLLQQMSAVNSRLNGLLLEAVTQAAGLPPNSRDLLEGAAQGKLDAVLEAGVAAYAGADPELTQSLGAFAEDARKAAQEYAKLKETVADVQERAKQGAQLVRAVQTGDVSRILTIGADIYEKLPADTRAEFLEKAVQAAGAKEKVEMALSLARQGTELRNEIADRLRSIPTASSVLRPAIVKLLDVGSADYDEHYSKLLQAAIGGAKTVTQQQDALIKLSRAWSGLVVDEVLTDPKLVIAAAVAMGSPCTAVGDCRQFLISRLRVNGLAGPAVTIEDSGRVVLSSPVTNEKIAEFRIQDIAARTFGTPIEVPRATILADANSLLARLDGEQGALIGRLLQLLPDREFDELATSASKALGTTGSKDFVAELLKPPAAGGASPLGESIARYSLGRDVVQRTVWAPAGGGPGPSAGGGGSTGTPEEQAALAALAATGPYGLAASMAIKVLSGMGELSDLADQARRLDDEDRGLSVELLHLTPLKHEIDNDEALAVLAHRAAELRSKSAANRGNLLRAALLDDSQRRLELSTKIRSRLPLNYYLSELLREQYDRLDQSIALWTGQSGSSGRRIENWLRADPRSARLALDPDIKLYSWFKRDWRGQRGDLDELAVRWNQLYLAARQACGTLGCDKDVHEVGFVEFTPAITLDSVAGDIAPKGTIREVSFTLLPQHIPDLQDIERLRLVDISAVVRNRTTGAASGLPSARIRHSGVGYMLAGGEGQVETFEVSDERSPDFIDGDSAISARRAALQSRWASSAGLGQLEGYALFGLYKVTLPSSFDPAKQSLELTFYYQRPKKAGVTPLRLPTAKLVCPSARGDTSIDISDVRLLVSRSETGLLDKVSAPDSCKLEENGR